VCGGNFAQVCSVVIVYSQGDEQAGFLEMVSQGACSPECVRKNRKEESVPATRDSELLNYPIQIFLQFLYKKWLVKVVAHPNV